MSTPPRPPQRAGQYHPGGITCCICKRLMAPLEEVTEHLIAMEEARALVEIICIECSLHLAFSDKIIPAPEKSG